MTSPQQVLLAILTGAWVLASSVPARAVAYLFNFENDPFSAATPFSSTSGSLTATFAGPADNPGGFEISYNSASGPFPRLYSNLNDAFLTTALTSLDPSSPLTITFSQPVDGVALNFALGGAAGTLSLTTNAGGSAQAAGRVPSGFRYAEGALSFVGAPFTVATLSTNATGLAVDDIASAPQAVPEPATLALFGAGLLAAAGLRRRSRA